MSNSKTTNATTLSSVATRSIPATVPVTLATNTFTLATASAAILISDTPNSMPKSQSAKIISTTTKSSMLGLSACAFVAATNFVPKRGKLSTATAKEFIFANIALIIVAAFANPARNIAQSNKLSRPSTTPTFAFTVSKMTSCFATKSFTSTGLKMDCVRHVALMRRFLHEKA